MYEKRLIKEIMHGTKLAQRKQYTNESALQIMKNGTDAEKADLAIALGFDAPLLAVGFLT